MTLSQKLILFTPEQLNFLKNENACLLIRSLLDDYMAKVLSPYKNMTIEEKQRELKILELKRDTQLKIEEMKSNG